MILANLYHIKQTNGLFYYGVDYLQACATQVRKILVRPALAPAARAYLPDKEIVICTSRRFLREIICAAWRGDFIYTPTSHPLPGLSRQWIVIHDTYPFSNGAKGRMKELLLRWSLATSHCRVAYINESDVMPFIAGTSVGPTRRVFAPNRFPAAPTPITRQERMPSDQLTVGLVGTDSAKKNYSTLFEAVKREGCASSLRFRAFGHASPYFNQLRAAFPDIQLELVESDQHSLEQFFGRVDLLVSIASQEGFGRPLAGALLAGIPCFLLDRPVFREFFDPGATFFPDAQAIVQALRTGVHYRDPWAVMFVPPLKAVAAYQAAVNELMRIGGNDL